MADMTPAELFQLLQSGTPLNNDQLDTRGDLEGLIKGVLANLAPGAFDPAAFEDVEVGRNTVELPSRPRFDRYSRAPVGTDERLVADKIVGERLSPSQYEAAYRARWAAEFPDAMASEEGPKLLDEAAKRARSDAEDLWEELDTYERAASQLSPEGQQALAAGRPSYEQVEYGPSKARRYFTDQGLSAPTDTFQDSDFGVDQVADLAKQQTARAKWESLGQRNDPSESLATRDDPSRNTFDPSEALRSLRGETAAGARYAAQAPDAQGGGQDLNRRILLATAADSRARSARTNARYAAGGEMVAANRSKAANKIRAEGMAAILAKHGRTPFTEQIRSKLGQ